MENVTDMLNYINNNINLDQNDFRSKIKIIYYHILTTKLYVVWSFYQT